MIETKRHRELVQHLSRSLIPLATGITLLISVLAPVTFWALAHRNLQHMVSIYADDLAQQLGLVAMKSPTLWKYQTHKLITEGFHPGIDVGGVRILDEKGEILYGHDNHKVEWEKPGKTLSFLGELHYTLGAVPIRFNGRQVGMVEVLADDMPTTRTSALILCFSSLVGIALGVLVYWFPVMVVRKMTEKIEELLISLRGSEEKYRILNAELELKIEERTRELLDAQEALVRKEKLTILGQLSGSVGHELRNPLGVMNNAVFFLKMVLAEADETVKEYLGIIEKEIANSLRIITDLLDFARTKTPQIKTVTVRELMDESLGRCTIPVNVALRTGIPDTLPLLRIDLLQMGQVLTNFISNAVQAMPKGGALRVAARLVPSSPATVQLGYPQATPPQDFIEIAVTDTGEGIRPENMGKLFQPLFTTKAKGIGLGLVVCRTLVEANGGRIEVASEFGKGACFSVQLPIEAGA